MKFNFGGLHVFSFLKIKKKYQQLDWRNAGSLKKI